MRFTVWNPDGGSGWYVASEEMMMLRHTIVTTRSMKMNDVQRRAVTWRGSSRSSMPSRSRM
jgi:hypothetical protein